MTSRVGSRAEAAPARHRAGAVGLALLLLALLGTAPAAAHEAGAGIRYRITGVPDVDGLTVQVLRGLAGQLVLANATGEVVEVLDDDGEAFLRIGPAGVEGDTASATWRASDRPFGLGGSEPGLDLADPDASEGDAPPRWAALSDGSSWGWYDHRLHARQVVAPADADGPVVVDTWTVPLRVGDREATITGETVGGPPLGFVVPRLVGGRDPGEGVQVTLLPGQAPGLLLSVDPGHEVTVRGEAGEPFLRFADGAVQVNAASPTWHRTGGAAADAVVVDAEAEPAWQRVAESQRFGWIEPRALAPEVDGNPEDGAVLSSWAVPLEVDGEPATVVGELRWARNPAADAGDGSPAPRLALAGAGLAAVAALVVVRRRGARRRT